MAVYSGFFNSLNGDRKYNALQFSWFFDGLIKDGVYENWPEGEDYADRAMHVSLGTGRSVDVAPGRAWFNRVWIYNDGVKNITLDNTVSTLTNRIDAIVIDVDTADSDIVDLQDIGRRADIIVVKGTESSTPDKPSMIHTATRNQYPLAYVTITGNNGSIYEIEDCLATGECPVVEALLNLSGDVINQIDARLDAVEAPTFQEAAQVANINSGETLGSLFGKIKKLISTMFSPGLPISMGGTGATTAQQALVNLGVPASVLDSMAKSVYTNSDDAVTVAHGGTGKTSLTSGRVLVGNGTDPISEREITNQVGTSANDARIATAGGLYTLQAAFQAGVDAVYNAVVAEGVTPSASTPTAIANAISRIRNGGTAPASKILEGYSAYSSKTLRYGSMSDYSGSSRRTVTPSGGTGNEQLSLSPGYHDSVIVNRTNAYNTGWTTGRGVGQSDLLSTYISFNGYEQSDGTLFMTVGINTNTVYPSGATQNVSIVMPKYLGNWIYNQLPIAWCYKGGHF